MPFKQGKTPSQVSSRLRYILESELPENMERGLFAMYTKLSGTADYYVPVDTAKLVKSRSYRIRQTGNKWRLVYGYYTDYALALHSPSKGGKMDGWKPMDPYEREWQTKNASEFTGRGTGGWNPNATQGWMSIAWNEVGDDAVRDFARMVKP